MHILLSNFASSHGDQLCHKTSQVQRGTTRLVISSRIAGYMLHSVGLELNSVKRLSMLVTAMEACVGWGAPGDLCSANWVTLFDRSNRIGMLMV